MNITINKQLSLVQRLWIYQKERFPFLQNGLIIAIFTFSAIAYSLHCRAESSFIQWSDFVIGVFITFTFFFLLRLFDEFKDQKEDALYRSYLPVPRGLVSLTELQFLIWSVIVLQVAIIICLQINMLPLYGIVLAYLLLMRVEFFVPKWLKNHPIIYTTSHMLILPFIDIYASGLDWKLSDQTPHLGLIYFFVVSFFNGLVIEFGRKIRTPKHEEKGVTTYSKLYGAKTATLIWVGLLLITMFLAFAAITHAELSIYIYYLLIFSALTSIIPAILFLKNMTEKRSQAIEKASGIWTISLYTSLGIAPYFLK